MATRPTTILRPFGHPPTSHLGALALHRIAQRTAQAPQTSQAQPQAQATQASQPERPEPALTAEELRKKRLAVLNKPAVKPAKPAKQETNAAEADADADALWQEAARLDQERRALHEQAQTLLRTLVDDSVTHATAPRAPNTNFINLEAGIPESVQPTQTLEDVARQLQSIETRQQALNKRAVKRLKKQEEQQEETDQRLLQALQAIQDMPQGSREPISGSRPVIVPLDAMRQNTDQQTTPHFVRYILERTDIDDATKHMILLLLYTYRINELSSIPSQQPRVRQMIDALYTVSRFEYGEPSPLAHIAEDGSLHMNRGLFSEFQDTPFPQDVLSYVFPFYLQSLEGGGTRDTLIQIRILTLFYQSGVNSRIQMRTFVPIAFRRLQVLQQRIRHEYELLGEVIEEEQPAYRQLVERAGDIVTRLQGYFQEHRRNTENPTSWERAGWGARALAVLYYGNQLIQPITEILSNVRAVEQARQRAQINLERARGVFEASQAEQRLEEEAAEERMFARQQARATLEQRQANRERGPQAYNEANIATRAQRAAEFRNRTLRAERGPQAYNEANIATRAQRIAEFQNRTLRANQAAQNAARGEQPFNEANIATRAQRIGEFRNRTLRANQAAQNAARGEQPPRTNEERQSWNAVINTFRRGQWEGEHPSRAPTQSALPANEQTYAPQYPAPAPAPPRDTSQLYPRIVLELARGEVASHPHQIRDTIQQAETANQEACASDMAAGRPIGGSVHCVTGQPLLRLFGLRNQQSAHTEARRIQEEELQRRSDAAQDAIRGLEGALRTGTRPTLDDATQRVQSTLQNFQDGVRTIRSIPVALTPDQARRYMELGSNGAIDEVQDIYARQQGIESARRFLDAVGGAASAALAVATGVATGVGQRGSDPSRGPPTVTDEGRPPRPAQPGERVLMKGPVGRPAPESIAGRAQEVAQDANGARWFVVDGSDVNLVQGELTAGLRQRTGPLVELVHNAQRFTGQSFPVPTGQYAGVVLPGGPRPEMVVSPNILASVDRLHPSVYQTNLGQVLRPSVMGGGTSTTRKKQRHVRKATKRYTQKQRPSQRGGARSLKDLEDMLQKGIDTRYFMADIKKATTLIDIFESLTTAMIGA